MSLTRTFKVLGKEFRLGPRSPVFLWVLFLPVLFTLILQVTFGSLFDPQPRLGIVDQGSSHRPTTFPEHLRKQFRNPVGVSLPVHASWLKPD